MKKTINSVADIIVEYENEIDSSSSSQKKFAEFFGDTLKETKV